VPSLNILKRRLRHRNRGVAAVEFAIIATPFLMMLFALVEIMMIFFVQTTLEAAVAEEARKIRTGQAQATTGGITATAFKANVCTKMYGLADCTNRLFVSVQSNPTGPLADPWADGTLNSADEPYQPANPGDMVVVRAFYAWPLMTPGLSTAFKTNLASGITSTLGANNRMLAAAAAFQNEPFR
jgi:Flp pilus assembly protein TadG